MRDDGKSIKQGSEFEKNELQSTSNAAAKWASRVLGDHFTENKAL
jgi:hypothetical protein